MGGSIKNFGQEAVIKLSLFIWKVNLTDSEKYFGKELFLVHLEFNNINFFPQKLETRITKQV